MWLFSLLIWGVAIYVAYNLGKKKNRNGLAWGILLGWIGVIALLCLPENKQIGD